MKSWKTTVSGLLGVLAVGLHVAATKGPPSWEWVDAVAAGLGAMCPLLLGLAARDNGVTSEQAGAGNVPPKVGP